MKKTRINKYLADLGLASRRQVDEFIKQGLVKVDGSPAQLGMKIDPSENEIEFKGKKFPLKDKEVKEYWKLYKPTGVISTTSDPGNRKTVLDFIDSDHRVYPVGRLDKESEGLLLVTNDGELTYKLTHPKFEIEKEYWVWYNGQLDKQEVELMKNGLILSDGLTAPARVKVERNQNNRGMFKIILTEGRNREVRRMAAKVGLTVTRLKRVRMANLKLGNLQPGEAEKLSSSELNELKQI